MRTLNLGILAHVDAGKTSLTERLLYAAGVIDAIGSVDDGTTQTDTLALERQRGITIKAAVASFSVGDVAVNLIDTPGHPDFIAEVERALCVLDGAVLVVSAVEGVQAQTRVLWRALARLRIPTLLFVNKIDRGGARPDAVLAAIAEKLSPAIVAMGAARDPGTRAAGFAAFGEADETFRARLVEQLAELDDRLLAAYVAGESPLAGRRLFRELARQTRRVRLHPVFLGSAITGAGVEALIAALPELLPARRGDTAGPLSAAVFKVERGAAGEKIAYVRVFSGTVHARDRLRLRDGEERKVTAIRAFAGRSEQRSESLAAGQIGKLWGLGDVRIGDPIGAPRAGADAHHFAPPTLETVVVPSRAQDRGALRTALAQLAEQDPLINLRQDDVRQELSLYGEVQKEVIAETLATEYGVRVEFRETTTLCIERPLGSGSAFEVIQKDANPFLATVGLRVARAAADSGVGYRLEVELGSLPYAFHKAVEETVRATLQQGLCGWEVTDCTVTMTHSGYSSPSSTAGDFRQLTPLVLMKALERAGTEVCEPIHRFRLEIPSGALGATLPILAGLRAVPESPVLRGATCALEGEIPAVRVHALRLQLASVTRGEGVLECAFERWRPVRGEPPSRARWGPDPLNRKEYLLQLSRRV